MEEPPHGGDGIDHSFVHVDVENVCAAGDLLTRHRESRFEVAAENEFREFRRSGDVGTLAHDDKSDVGGDVQRFESGKLKRRDRPSFFGIRERARRAILDDIRDQPDVFGCGAASSTDEIEPAVLRPFA